MTSGRQRRWAPKVRTGCRTCKTRKKRCDEAKPVCQMCRKGGYVCDGYGEHASSEAVMVQNSTLLEAKADTVLETTAPQIAEESINGSCDLLPPDLVLAGHLNFVYFTSDQRSTQFFIARVAPVLATTKAWQTFWEDTIPLTSVNDTPVHHAMLALSSAYESKFLNTDRRGTTIQQISQAIKSSMTRPITIDNTLILCRLLAAVSQSTGDWKTAMIHLQHGWRILLENVRSGQVRASLSELLGPMFLCASTRALDPAEHIPDDMFSDRDSILKLDCIRTLFAVSMSTADWNTIRSSTVRTSVILAWSNMTRALYSLVCPNLYPAVSDGEPGTIPISVVMSQLCAHGGLLDVDHLHAESGSLLQNLTESRDQLQEGSVASLEVAERLRYVTANFMVSAFLLNINARVDMFWSADRSVDCDIDVHLLRLKADESVHRPGLFDGKLSIRLQVERRNQENYLECICPYRSGFLPALGVETVKLT